MPEIMSLMDLVDRILDALEDGTLDAGFEEPIERGSASGSVTVLKKPEHAENVVVVRLSIMRVPETAGAAFYERLLELNHVSVGRAALSIDDGVVHLTSGRPVEDLDPGELIDLILWTSEYADTLDDELLAEFGSENAL